MAQEKGHFEQWREKSAMNGYKPLFNGSKPWTTADVKAFVESDAVHGPRLEKMRSAAVVAHAGGVAGAVGMGAFCLTKSRTLLGGTMGAVGGWFAGFLFTTTVTGFTHGLNSFNTHETNGKFLEYVNR